jgi:hypothetical protein
MTSIRTVTLPMRVVIPRKTKKDLVIPMNLNNYRNVHWAVKNSSKKLFGDMIIDQLEGVGKLIPPIGLVYTYYSSPKCKTKDIANVLSVSDKYFSDVLTKNGLIDDDNFNILERVVFQYGGEMEEETITVEIMEEI